MFIISVKVSPLIFMWWCAIEGIVRNQKQSRKGEARTTRGSKDETRYVIDFFPQSFTSIYTFFMSFLRNVYLVVVISFIHSLSI